MNERDEMEQKCVGARWRLTKLKINKEAALTSLLTVVHVVVLDGVVGDVAECVPHVDQLANSLAAYLIR